MTKIVNVRFHDAGKSYKFSCDNMKLNIGDAVMVETSLGLDLAHVVEEAYDLDTKNFQEEILDSHPTRRSRDIRSRRKKKKRHTRSARCSSTSISST